MELVPSTPDEYVKLTTSLVRVKSGGVFKLKTMDAPSLVYAMDVFEEEQIDNQKEIIRFVKENFEVIANKIVHPNILEPKLQPEQLFFMDVVDLFMELMVLSKIIEVDDKDDEG